MRPAEFQNGVGADALRDAAGAAHYPQASRSWVYQRGEAGRLPYLRIGALPTENAP